MISVEIALAVVVVVMIVPFKMRAELPGEPPLIGAARREIPKLAYCSRRIS
jgi:hypothetical protein